MVSRQKISLRQLRDAEAKSGLEKISGPSMALDPNRLQLGRGPHSETHKRCTYVAWHSLNKNCTYSLKNDI